MRNLLVVIPTIADFVPARRPSFERVIDSIAKWPPDCCSVWVLRDKEPAWSWAARAYACAIDMKKDLLILQDDVLLADRAWEWFAAMRSVHPDRVLALHANHPGARKLFVDGPVRWYSTVDGLVGPAHLWPLEKLESMVDWMDAEVPQRVRERINEDDMCGLWAMANNERIFHPVVTPIDHDISIDSTYGNDNHRQRRPAVTWRDAEWYGDTTDYTQASAWQTTCAHFGRYYRSSYLRLRHVMKDKQEAELTIQRLERDVCPEQYGRWFAFG